MFKISCSTRLPNQIFKKNVSALRVTIDFYWGIDWGLIQGGSTFSAETVVNKDRDISRFFNLDFLGHFGTYFKLSVSI